MRKWTRQPPRGTKIDWKNPVTEQLVGAFCASTHGLNSPDVLGNAADTTEAASNRDIAPAARGLATVHTGTDGWHVFRCEQINDWVSPISGFVYFYVAGNAGGAPALLGTNTNENVGVGAGWSFQLEQWNGSNLIGLTLGGAISGGAGNINDQSSIATPVNTHAVMGFTYDPVTTTVEYFLLKDGGSLQYQSKSLSPTESPTTDLRGYVIGGWGKITGSLGDALPAGVRVYCAYVWNRVLPKAQMEAIVYNPYLIFKGPHNFALATPLPQTRALEVPKTRVWTKQPPAGTPLDENHWLYQNIRWMYVGGERNEKITGVSEVAGWASGFSAITPRQTDMFGGVLTQETVPDGPNIEFPDSQRVADMANLRNWSCLYYGHVTSIDASAGLMARGSAGGSGGNFSLTALSGLDIRLRLYNPAFNQASGIAVPTLPKTIGYVAAVEPSGAQEIVRYYGWWDHTLSQATSGLDDLSFPDGTFGSGYAMVVGSQAKTTWDNEAAYGNHMLALLIDRTLTKQESESLLKNPWQLFEPESIQVPIEYEELTFTSEGEERLFIIPRKKKRPRT